MNLFSSVADDLVAQANTLFEGLKGLPLEDKIRAINDIRRALHQYSPFASEPVDCVIWAQSASVEANDYNPNSVAPPEMRLLEHSIRADGYTQPIVAYQDTENHYVVVDGYHRNLVGTKCSAVRKRIHGYLPITVIKSDRANLKDRIAATIRHNRARGVHGIVPMIDIVADLIRNGWSDTDIAKELGMDADEVLRFKQNSGLPELFKDHKYSRAWE